MDAAQWTIFAISIAMIVVIALWWGRQRGAASRSTRSDPGHADGTKDHG